MTFPNCISLKQYMFSRNFSPEMPLHAHERLAGGSELGRRVVPADHPSTLCAASWIPGVWGGESVSRNSEMKIPSLKWTSSWQAEKKWLLVIRFFLLWIILHWCNKTNPLLGLLDPGHWISSKHPVFLQHESGISNIGPFLWMPANSAIFSFIADKRLFTMERKYFRY